MTTDHEIIQACINSNSMAEACSKTDLHFNTFKRRAQILGVYKPNQGKRGSKKPKSYIYSLEDILRGLYPHYQTYKLKVRLYDSSIKHNKCEMCGLCEWNGQPIQCELDHIDGNPRNHKLENLRILCPNCHSQTETFRAKNKKHR